MIALCRDCGAPFFRDERDRWKSRCLRCWRSSRSSHEPPRPAAPMIAPDPLRAELRDRMRALLMLTHPDKHHGSQLATDITAWLLTVRKRIEGPGAAR